LQVSFFSSLPPPDASEPRRAGGFDLEKLEHAVHPCPTQLLKNVFVLAYALSAENLVSPSFVAFDFDRCDKQKFM
jgi:hypothetical protein